MNVIFFRLIVSIFVYLSIIANAIAFHAYNEIEVNNVDLNQFPQHVRNDSPEVEVSIGDLHGNSLKLLYFLIRNDVMRIPPKDYQSFIRIYKKSPRELTGKDLAMFHAIMYSATINPQHKLRFLGDELCDRGMNDYYTLYLFKALDEANVYFEIVLSNHGNFFLEAYERPEKSFRYNPYGEGRHESIVRSMLNLGKLIDNGLVEKQDIVNIIQTHYLNHIVFPGMTVNKEKNELTIYTHAPVDLKIMSHLASDLNIRYQDENLDHLVSTYKAINNQIHTWIIHNQFTANYKRLKDIHEKEGTQSPIAQILWNRDYTILNRDYKPEGKSYKVNYVHGHDSQSNVFDLDNLFGKGDHHDRGPYAIYITHPILDQ